MSNKLKSDVLLQNDVKEKESLAILKADYMSQA